MRIATLRRKATHPILRVLATIIVILTGRPDGWWVIGSTIYPPASFDEDPEWGTLCWIEHNRSELIYARIRQWQNESLGAWILLLGRYPCVYTLPMAICASLAAPELVAVWFVIAFFGLFFSFGPYAYGRWLTDRQALIGSMRYTLRRDPGLRPEEAALLLTYWLHMHALSPWPLERMADDLLSAYYRAEKRDNDDDRGALNA